MSSSGPRDRLGKVKGTDFLHFYVTGTLLRAGDADALYDWRAHLSTARQIAQGDAGTLYLPVESPQTALAFAPLAALPYSGAFALWSLVIAALYAASCWMIFRCCGALRPYSREVIICAAAFPGLFSTVLHGQTSAIGVFLLSAGLLALANGRTFPAGLALGCLVFKPHWWMAAVAVFLVAGELRVVAGAAIGAALQTAVTALIVGSQVMRLYVRALRSILTIGDLLEPFPGDSLSSFFKVFAPFGRAPLVFYIIAAVATLGVAARIWRSGRPFEVKASAAVVAMLLISPHTLPYDLVMLAPVLMLSANWMLRTGGGRAGARWLVPWVLCALYVGPLLAGLPAVLRLQFSVTAMAALLVLFRESEDGSPLL